VRPRNTSENATFSKLSFDEEIGHKKITCNKNFGALKNMKNFCQVLSANKMGDYSDSGH
jgi:hypothetical protein